MAVGISPSNRPCPMAVSLQVAERPVREIQKMRVPEYLWEVQTPPMRIESLLMGGFCISPNLEPTDMLIHFIFYKSMLF